MKSLANEVIPHFTTIVGETNVLSTAPNVWQLVPRAAVEITEIVRVATQHNLTISVFPAPLPTDSGAHLKNLPSPGPRSIAPSDVAGSEAPSHVSSRPHICLDLRKLNHVVRLDETSLLVHAQAGLQLTELEQILNRRTLTLGDYPHHLPNATVGTMISRGANAAGGPLYGATEDNILGISAVLASGRTANTRITPRRATGPDITRLWYGGDNQFGIITSATLRIYRQPDTRLLIAHRLPNFKSAFNAAQLALREEAAPERMQILDAALANLTYDIHLAPHEVLLLAATAGKTDLSACDRDLVVSASKASGGQDEAESIANQWWEHRPDINNLQLQISAPIKNLFTISQTIASVCNQIAIPLGLTVHYASTQIAVFSIYWTGDTHQINNATQPNSDNATRPNSDNASSTTFQTAISTLTEAVTNHGASIVGAPKADFATSLRTLQQQLDPNHVFLSSPPLNAETRSP